jgi:hypothetical protein
MLNCKCGRAEVAADNASAAVFTAAACTADAAVAASLIRKASAGASNLTQHSEMGPK